MKDGDADHDVEINDAYVTMKWKFFNSIFELIFSKQNYMSSSDLCNLF